MARSQFETETCLRLNFFWFCFFQICRIDHCISVLRITGRISVKIRTNTGTWQHCFLQRLYFLLFLQHLCAHKFLTIEKLLVLSFQADPPRHFFCDFAVNLPRIHLVSLPRLCQGMVYSEKKKRDSLTWLFDVFTSYRSTVPSQCVLHWSGNMRWNGGPVQFRV